MFCTKCGIELRDQDRFCSDCGTSTGQGPAAAKRPDQLSRPVAEAKIAGVCAGFARYFSADVTLIRILWLAMTIWPLPLFGVVTYIVAWIVMPKDRVLAEAQHLRPANGQAT
ncbi:MAG TPA: PspC domain-containing protein [Bryobacteraceae bacterium]|nr:PspC domain-containing protein [Bryobacteraceae bacterium]